MPRARPGQWVRVALDGEICKLQFPLHLAQALWLMTPQSEGERHGREGLSSAAGLPWPHAQSEIRLNGAALQLVRWQLRCSRRRRRPTRVWLFWART